MFNVSFICRQVNGQGEQLYCAYLGIRKQYEFDHIVHAICVGKSISYS